MAAAPISSAAFPNLPRLAMVALPRIRSQSPTRNRTRPDPAGTLRLRVVLGELGQLGRLGARGGAVLVADGRVDLLAVDRDGARRADADADGVADGLHDLDDDVVADHDALAGAAGDDEHCASSLESAGNERFFGG